jgi:phage terminase Nu1 subunit (DNA packaging protein)
MGYAKKPEIAFHSLREKDIAEAFHITGRQVRNWVKGGCPINPDRSYSLFNVHEWLMDRQKKQLEAMLDTGSLGSQKMAKEIELLTAKIEKQNIENEELRKNTVSKYLYNRAISTICEAFSKFLVDVIKRNILRLRAIPEDELPAAVDELGIQATKHMVQSVKRVEQSEA